MLSVIYNYVLEKASSYQVYRLKLYVYFSSFFQGQRPSKLISQPQQPHNISIGQKISLRSFQRRN